TALLNCWRCGISSKHSTPLTSSIQGNYFLCHLRMRQVLSQVIACINQPRLKPIASYYSKIASNSLQIKYLLRQRQKRQLKGCSPWQNQDMPFALATPGHNKANQRQHAFCAPMN